MYVWINKITVRTACKNLFVNTCTWGMYIHREREEDNERTSYIKINIIAATCCVVWTTLEKTKEPADIILNTFGSANVAFRFPFPRESKIHRLFAYLSVGDCLQIAHAYIEDSFSEMYLLVDDVYTKKKCRRFALTNSCKDKH